MFMPDQSMTRAQTAALLAKAEKWPLDGIGPAYTDVSTSDWFYAPVEAAASQEAMSGTAAGVFDPNGVETQAQAIVSVVRTLGLRHVADDDAPAGGDWASGSYAVASDLGLIPQPSEPDSPLTRARAAVLVEAMLNVTSAQLRAEGNSVASSIFIGPSRMVNAGATVQMRVGAYDSAGYVVPADFRWSASGGSITATGKLTAGTSGTVRVTAHVPGGPTDTVALVVQHPVALAFEPASSVVSAGTSLTLAVDVVDGQGKVDVADSGRTITLSAGTSTWSASDSFGTASFHILLPPESATLTATADGLSSAAMPVTATPSTYALKLTAGPLQAGQSEPLTVAVVDGAGNPAPGTFAVRLTADGGASIEGVPATISGASSDATLTASRPGPVAVTAAVTGGAVASGTISVQVTPAGTLTVSGPKRVTAGDTASLTFSGSLPDGDRLTVVATDPDGNNPPGYSATFSGGAATIQVAPTMAGTWQLQGFAVGLSGTATLKVVPGPATQVVIHPVPTSILLPGQQAKLVAGEGDQYGNLIQTARVLALTGPGKLQGTTYTAPAGPGEANVTASVAGLPTTTVTLRTVPDVAAIAAGKGMWLIFPDWRTEGAPAIVTAAQAAGVTHIYLEVATSSDGFYGARALDDLLWQAHDAGIAVIAWVYPALWQPAQDIAETQAVAAYATPLGERADGLAADIEENMDPPTVAAYGLAARQAVGRGLLVGVTYPPQQMPGYPFASLLPYVDVWGPMDYWHQTQHDYTYHDVYTWVADSIDQINAAAGSAAVPFDVILQTYDAFADSGEGIFSPTPDELGAAMAAAASRSAEGVSFYRWTTATTAEWQVASGLP